MTMTAIETDRYEPNAYDRQARQDRARVEALRQATLRHAGLLDTTTDAEVVETAKFFEGYLNEII
jgi:hypothetical protein